ncbi:hypothetical protein [Amycolatopsis sp. NPDC054798]
MTRPADPNRREPRRQNPRPDIAKIDALLARCYHDALEEGRRADTQAARLLSLTGVLAAAVTSIASLADLPLAATTMLWVAAAPIAAAFARLLLATRPTGETLLARFAGLPAAAVLRELADDYAGGSTYYRADRLQAHAAVVTRKNRAIRHSAGFVLTGVAALAAAALLTAVAR